MKKANDNLRSALIIDGINSESKLRLGSAQIGSHTTQSLEVIIS